MAKENKVVVKLSCFPGPCRTGKIGVSRFFVSDRWDNVRNKIGRCRIFRRPQDRQNNTLYYNSNNGFTLIELLVVVLIIGILAAVALPQYQKAVEKSKASQAFVTLKSVQQAFEAYRLANGEYPTKFEDTAISLPSMTGNVAQLRESDGNTPDTISDKDWSLQIQTDTPSGEGTYYLVLMSRITGKYQGAGFQLILISNGFPEKEGKIVCNERVSEANFLFTQSAGSYCKNIFKGTLYNDAGFVRNYSL